MSIEIILLIILILLAATSAVMQYISIKNKSVQRNDKEIERLLTRLEGRLSALENSGSATRNELSSIVQISVKNMGDILAQNQKAGDESNLQRLIQLENRLKTFSTENEQKLENIRNVMESRLLDIRKENSQALDRMRMTVDEKLQKTLEEKMNRSFALVNERLEQVYKGLGEMQNLANDVGGLKKVLSNVKTRGIIGEIQLGAILKEVLSPEQYEENAITKKGSRNFVEFAVKLPSDDDGFIYLPIDSKFPGDTYSTLCDAYDNGDKAQIEQSRNALKNTLKNEARDIKEKYIDPPNTTDFAVMFLPFEGLYAEAVNSGIVEILQRDYKVNIAGPSTMAALLNSLQMGFKTLAVQKQSTEVWRVLGSVKAEFDKFNEILLKTQERIDQANQELDKLVGVRSRKISLRLSELQKFDGYTFLESENNKP